MWVLKCLLHVCVPIGLQHVLVYVMYSLIKSVHLHDIVNYFVVFDDSGNFLIFASMVGIKGTIMCCVWVCPGCMTVGIATISHHSDQPLYQQVCQDDWKGTCTTEYNMYVYSWKVDTTYMYLNTHTHTHTHTTCRRRAFVSYSWPYIKGKWERRLHSVW